MLLRVIKAQVAQEFERIVACQISPSESMFFKGLQRNSYNDIRVRKPCDDAKGTGYDVVIWIEEAVALSEYICTKKMEQAIEKIVSLSC